MAGYTYTAPTSGYSGTIAQMLARRGEIAAAAAEQIGAANARAAEQSGNAWAGAAQTIGQSVGQIPQQQIKDKTLAVDAAAKTQALQAGALRLASDQRGAAGQTAMAGLMADPQGPAAEGQPPPSNPYLKKEGDVSVWDVEGLSKAMAAQGFGDLSPQVVKDVGSLNQAHRDEAASRAKFGADQQNVMARGAGAALGMLRDHPTADPKLIVGFIGDQMKANGTFPPDKIDAVTEQLLADPAQLQTRLELLSRSSTAAPVALKKDEQLLNPTDLGGKPLASNMVPAEPTVAGLEDAANKLRAKKLQGVPLTPDETASLASYDARHPQATKAIEQKSVLLHGKSAIVNYDPATGKSSLPDGTDVSSQIAPIPPASIIIHNQQAAAGQNMPAWSLDDSRPGKGPEANALDPAIKMTPNGLYQAAQNYIANGQFPPTGRGNDATAIAQRAAITSKVGAIAAASGMDESALRAFYKSNSASLTANVKMQDAVSGFMATADKNADLLQESIKKIPDTGSPIFNKPVREFAKSVTGDPNLSQFATYLQSVQNEYGRIISQPNLAGQLTDSARHEAEQLIDPKATIPQILASIQALKNEGTNRLVSVGETIQRIQQRMQSPPTPPAAAPAATGGPAVGERRMISGQLGEWDGKGWKAVVSR